MITSQDATPDDMVFHFDHACCSSTAQKLVRSVDFESPSKVGIKKASTLAGFCSENAWLTPLRHPFHLFL
ncbi:MAG: hypothetical protein K2Y28_15395 [Burkholderiaceae bacterium]|nr:hypothetical protein [Burkholderiaceae bacterium]